MRRRKRTHVGWKNERRNTVKEWKSSVGKEGKSEQRELR